MLTFFTVASFILLLACIWLASVSHPVRATFGETIYPASLDKTAGKTLNIGAYNIHRCRGLDGKKDLVRVAALVESLDVVGLYEVEGPGLASLIGAGAKDQVARIAAVNRTGWLFWEAWKKRLRVSSGCGLLSRYAITEWHTENLPGNSPNNYRVLFCATLNMAGERVKLFSTHLSRRADREFQLEYVLQRFCQHEKAILIGDLNAGAEHELIKDYLERGLMIDATADGEPTQTVEPQGRLDWILLRGLQVLDKHRVDSPASDHPLYWSKVSLPDR